jgi:FkbM family methyltransferase
MTTPKPSPFVLMSTQHGSMIINRNDYHETADNRAYGVGYQLMSRSCYDPNDVQLILELLKLRHATNGDGVVALDCGANIGVHTIEWANLMTGWGEVHAFEAQEKIFYALAGNIILNNCLNASAKHLALGSSNGKITIPEPDYLKPASFGSFELKKRENNEYIGQKIDYVNANKEIDLITLDSLDFARLDLMKIDVEGMEEEVLNGARKLISTHKPIIFIEIIKSNKQNLINLLEGFNYKYMRLGMNILAINQDDECMNKITFKDGAISIKRS